MQRLFSALFIFLVGASTAFAQTPSPAPAAPATVSRNASTLEKQFLKNILKDQKTIWTSPFKIQTGDLKWVVPFTAGTAAFIATDRDTGDWIAEIGAKHSDLLPVSKGISYAGEHYTVGAAAAAFYLVGRATGNERVMLTERGTFFGYNRLVNDFTGLAIMKSFRVPVIFDITHSTQQPAGLGESSGGNPQYSPLLARAAVAAGVDGLFLECHPDPKRAKSDAATMLSLEEVEPLLTQCRQIAELRRSWSWGE